jgi:hypothetical protein
MCRWDALGVRLEGVSEGKGNEHDLERGRDVHKGI